MRTVGCKIKISRSRENFRKKLTENIYQILVFQKVLQKVLRLAKSIAA